MQQFNQQKRHTWDRIEVLHIRRGENESTEEFISRYNKESLQIAGAGEDLLIAGFLQGVRNDDLIRRLHGKEGLPKMMKEIMDVARIYVRAEKAVKNSQEFIKKEPVKESNKEGWNKSKRFRLASSWVRLENTAQDKKHENVTKPKEENAYNKWQNQNQTKWVNKLTKTPSEVLVFGMQFDPLKPMNPHSKQDPTKYCEFHKDIGHEMDSCFQLQKQIDLTVQLGTLVHLLKEIRDGPAKSQQVQPMIRAHPWASTQQRMTIAQPRVRPIIIDARAAGKWASKILVDTGADVNTMFLKFFMDYPGNLQSLIQ